MKKIWMWCGLLWACCLADPFTAGAQEVNVTLLHTNDFHSALEKRGRLLGTLERLRSQADHSLLLDAGDMFEGDVPQVGESEGQVIVEMMNQAGYDGMVFGDNAYAALNLEQLRACMQGFAFPIVCANLVNKSNGDPITIPYWIHHRGGASIAVLGIYDEESLSDQGLIEINPRPVVDFYLHFLKDKVDCVILLTHQGLEKDRELAQRFPQIDVIVGGSSEDVLMEPEQVGETLIVQAGGRGQYVGVLRMTIDTQANTIRQYEGFLEVVESNR